MAAAVGDVYSKGIKRSVRLLVNRTTNQSAPTASTDGIPVYRTAKQAANDLVDTGLAFPFRDVGPSTLMVKGRCTAGQTLVGTLTLWGYLEEADTWFEIPVNGGTVITPVALAETSADQINIQQQFSGLGHYDRIAIELASIGGTGATFDAWLVTGTYGA